MDTGLTSVVLRAARPLLVDRKVAAAAQRDGDAIKLSGIEIPYVESGRQAAIWLGAPLLSHGKAFGVMAVQDYANESAYGENEKQLLTFVAEQTALAITRKQAEQALRDSEEQHRALFEAASQGVMLHDEKAFLAVRTREDARVLAVIPDAAEADATIRDDIAGAKVQVNSDGTATLV